MHFKIDLASLIVGRKSTVFALFYFVFEGNFQVQAPTWRAYIWRGNLTEGFALPVWGPGLYLEGLIHEGAYFRNFTVRYVVDSVYYTFICHTFETSLNSWFCGNTSSTNSSSASLQNALHGIDTLGIVSREDNNIG